MDAKEFQREQQWLDRVYHEIDKQLAYQQDKVEGFYQEMLDIRRTLSEDHAISSASSKRMMDVAQRIAELRQGATEFGVEHRRLGNLRALERNPYFGRIDFHEEGTPFGEPLYIGVRTLLDEETGSPLVYDWRAPISSMFYDYGLGEAQYEGPGGVFRGRITLKRQYRIKNRRLVYMFDNDLTIDDEVLQEVLGQRTTDKMRTIVNTIQREQNRAIRNDEDRRLLVEGAAGSGKTAVALHRIAYLLYKYRDSMQAENILVFSPNRIFGDYISQVLPDLGEENVPQITFQEFAESFFNWEWEVETQVSYLEQLVAKGEKERELRLQSCSFKSSAAFQMVLNQLIDLVSKEVSRFEDVYVGSTLLISGQEQASLFSENYAYLPVQKRLFKIRQRILHLLRPWKKRRIRAVFSRIQRAEAFEGESWLSKAREAVGRVRGELRPLLTLLESRYTLESIVWYKRLWEDPRLWECLAGDLRIPPGAKDSIQTLDRGVISFEDAAPLLYLKGELEGYPVRRSVRHVVIDEVQDYAPLQLQAVLNTFPTARCTLVGDVFQSLNPYVWGSGGDRLEDVFSGLGLSTVRLNKSYRSTEEIFRFCSAILGRSPAETVLRTGRKPTVHWAAKDKQIQLISQLIQANRSSGYETIAVIAKTAQECREIHQALSRGEDGLRPTLLVKESDEFQKGVLVLPVALAKGLEFDAVVIADASVGAFSAAYDRRLLYVACSRAMHNLDLVCVGDKAPLIENLSAGLYHLDQTLLS